VLILITRFRSRNGYWKRCHGREETMKIKQKKYLAPLAILLLFVFPGKSLADNEPKKVDVDIGINKEDKEVGLKRMELIDKMLSRDLIERKRKLVQTIEKDYNKKISTIIDSIIPPTFDNKVLTHIDVNFFDPDFESQIRASQKAAVSIILKRDGFNYWAEQNSSASDALGKMKQLIGNTFNIPDDNISILIVN
jgi:hypothetical protein